MMMKRSTDIRTFLLLEQINTPSLPSAEKTEQNIGEGRGEREIVQSVVKSFGFGLSVLRLRLRRIAKSNSKGEERGERWGLVR